MTWLKLFKGKTQILEPEMIKTNARLMILNDLDEFYFRWLENSAIEIAKRAKIPLIFNHLKCELFFSFNCIIYWCHIDFTLCLRICIYLQTQFLTLKTGHWQIDRLFIRFSIGGILFSNSMNNLEINVPENAFGIMDTRQLQIDYYSSFESYMQYN